MAKKTPKEAAFTITLQIGDKTFKATGDTPLSALAAMPKPEKMMNKAMFTLSDGKNSKTQTMYPTRLKRLFMSRAFQEIQMKQLVNLLK